VTAKILLPGKLTSGATGVHGDSYSSGLKYAAAIARAGGVANTVAPLQEHIVKVGELVAASDGVLIQGGGDIEPNRYGETQRTYTVYGIVPAHDDFEIAVVREAVRLNKSVLAICPGIQVLNVALGGTLHQHWGDVLSDRESHWDTYHPIALEPGSRIAEEMRTLSPEHSHSFHHQALKEVAVDLAVTARAPDGVIEAVEHSRCKWIVGVQWHPEDNAAESTSQQSLFDAFVAQC